MIMTDNLGLTLDTLAESNSHSILVLEDFSIKFKNFSIKFNINHKITTEGANIEFVTLQYGLHQIINEPAHVLENSLSSMDLIFSTQPN